MKSFSSFITIFILTVLLLFGQSKIFSAKMDNYLKTHHFSGVVAVTEAGKPIFEKAYSFANQEFQIVNTLETRFRICSVTKTFTAVLILQLVDEGRLKLVDKIGAILPDFKGEAAQKVSIENLLTYSSGREMKEYYDTLLYENKVSMDDFITKYCEGKLLHEPGTKFEYNNGDYIILGKIIATIYQKPWEQVLSEKILLPCKMENTGVLNSHSIIPKLAEGYMFDKQTLQKEPPYYPESYASAGAMYSTIKDLQLFDNALYNNLLLNKQTTEIMLKSHEDLGYVAFGFWTYPNTIGDKTYRFAERQGDILGSKALWLRNLDTQKSILVLSNAIEGDINELKELLIK